jgi:CarD family transcriptional regulator
MSHYRKNQCEQNASTGYNRDLCLLARGVPVVVISKNERVQIMASTAVSFDVGDYVVYPKHGVGRVIELQNSEIAGMQLELYVLRFEKERMTLRVPINKAESVGMRKLSSDKTLKEAMQTLTGKPKVKRTMWSRRAQEYEAKINSGDLVSIAEVTRDLFRPDDQPEQSYSERQIFEAASSRLARELAAMEKTDEPAALLKILGVLKVSAPQYYEKAE